MFNDLLLKPAVDLRPGKSLLRTLAILVLESKLQTPQRKDETEFLTIYLASRCWVLSLTQYPPSRRSPRRSHGSSDCPTILNTTFSPLNRLRRHLLGGNGLSQHGLSKKHGKHKTKHERTKVNRREQRIKKEKYGGIVRSRRRMERGAQQSKSEGQKNIQKERNTRRQRERRANK